jgi:ketol-acid reductoisomerase
MGTAVALNLLDSGWTVHIYLRNLNRPFQSENKNYPNLKLHMLTEENLRQETHPLFLMIPDQEHENFLRQYQACMIHIPALIYAHGFSQTAYKIKQQFPQFEHILFAIKSIAREVRENYLSQSLIMAGIDLSSVSPSMQDWIQKLSIAVGVKSHTVETTFEEECINDLFTEQSILCYFLPYLSAQTYETLTNEGISSDMAFIESFYEMDLILKTMLKVGPKQFFSLISPNALIGSEWARDFYKDEISPKKMREHIQLLKKMDLKKFFSTNNYLKAKESNQNFWDNHPFQIAFEKWKKSCQ